MTPRECPMCPSGLSLMELIGIIDCPKGTLRSISLGGWVTIICGVSSKRARMTILELADSLT